MDKDREKKVRWMKWGNERGSLNLGMTFPLLAAGWVALSVCTCTSNLAGNGEGTLVRLKNTVGRREAGALVDNIAWERACRGCHRVKEQVA